MKMIKRIIAILGVVLLVGLYILTFISGIFSTKETENLFFTCIYCTITIPCLLYGFQLIYRILHKDKDINTEEEKKENRVEKNSKK